MYAIFQIVFGVHLSEELLAKDSELSDAVDEELDGILQFYSGAGDTPTAFGIELGSFDECSTYKVKDLTLEPTQAQREEYYTNLANLPPTLCAKISALGKPEVFLLPSTS